MAEKCLTEIGVEKLFFCPSFFCHCFLCVVKITTEKHHEKMLVSRRLPFLFAGGKRGKAAERKPSARALAV